MVKPDSSGAAVKNRLCDTGNGCKENVHSAGTRTRRHREDS